MFFIQTFIELIFYIIDKFGDLDLIFGIYWQVKGAQDMKKGFAKSRKPWLFPMVEKHHQ
jgi:hypothetical protein